MLAKLASALALALAILLLGQVHSWAAASVDVPCNSMAVRPALLQVFEALGGNATWGMNAAGWSNASSDPCCYELDALGSCVAWSGLGCLTVNGTIPPVVPFSGLFIVASLEILASDAFGVLPDAICSVCGLRNLGTLLSTVTTELPSCLAKLPLVAIEVMLVPHAPIPTWLNDMPLLSCLVIAGERIFGTIPDLRQAGSAVGGLRELAVFGLDARGSHLPDMLRDLTNMSSFVCTSCRFGGEIPSWLGELDNLELLDLDDNQLSGSLPDIWDQFPQLRFLSLARNNISGAVPPTFAHLALVNLSLASNSLSSILDERIDPRHLVSLDLSFNYFSGTLPANLAQASNLASLLVRGNQFSGPIPDYLVSLPRLNLLDLGWNAFDFVNRSLCWSCAPVLSSLSFEGLILNDWPYVLCDCDDSEIGILSLSHTQRLDSSGLASNCTLEDALASLAGFASYAEMIRRLNLVPIFGGLSDLGLVHAGLVGPLSPVLFDMFPLLQNVYLSGNALSGSLRFVSLLASQVTLLDLTENRFEGALPPTMLAPLMGSLRLLNLQGNPALVQSANQSVLEGGFVHVSWRLATQNATLGTICPRLVGEASGVLLVDPSYFNYALCQCATRFYGRVAPDGTGCKLVSELCATASGLCYVGTANGTVQVAPGFWPGPDPAAASQLVPCSSSSAGLRSGMELCNANGTLVCSPNAAGTLTCGPTAAICTLAGQAGRFCSSCQPGFFSSSNGCISCRVPHDQHVKAIVFLLLTLFGAGAAFVMFARHSIRPTSEEILSLRLTMQQAKAPALVVFVRLFWLDCALVVAVNVGLLANIVQASKTALLPKLVAVLAVAVIFSFSIYYLQARLLPATLDRTVQESGAGLLFNMRPSVVRSAFANLVSALKSLFTFVFIYATLVASIRPPGDSDERQLFAILVNPLLSIDWVRCTFFLRSLSQFHQNLALIALSYLYPLFFIAAFGAGSLCRFALLRRSMRSRLQRAVGQHDEAMRIQVAQAHARASLTSIRTSALSFAFVILTMSQFSAIQLFTQAIACRSFAFGSYSTLFPDLPCFSVDHAKLIVLASVLTVAQLVPYFAIFYRVSTYARAGRLREPPILRAYGIVYESYHPRRWWFELVLAAKRILLALAYGALGSMQTYANLFVCMAVLLVCFALQCSLRPFVSAALNRIELSTTGFLVLASVLVRAEPNDRLAIFSFEVGMNAFIQFYLVYIFFQGIMLVPYVRDVFLAALMKANSCCCCCRWCFLHPDSVSLVDELGNDAVWHSTISSSEPRATLTRVLDPATRANPDVARTAALARLRAADAAASRAERVRVGVQLRLRRERAEMEATIASLRAVRDRVLDERGHE